MLRPPRRGSLKVPVCGAGPAVSEYLATLNDAAFGSATEVEPKFVSPSDSSAQWTGALKDPVFCAYADNYLIDVEFGIIVDIEAPCVVRQAEFGAARTMLELAETALRALKPQGVVADSGYGLAPMLKRLVEQKRITPAHPRQREVQARRRDLLACRFPLPPSHRHVCLPCWEDAATSNALVNDGITALPRQHPRLRLRPTSTESPMLSTESPMLSQYADPQNSSQYVGARSDVARSLAGTAAFEQSRHDRKRIEMRFVHLKRSLWH
jgi:hypothetical protein